MLESPNLYAWYPYAYRWWQRIWHFSSTSSFEIIQILVILPKNAISLGSYNKIGSYSLSVWGMWYTSYIKRVLSCDFKINPENGNIDRGGGFWKKIVCYFSIPASPPTLLMLESPNIYAWYPYAYRWWQRISNLPVLKKIRFQLFYPKMQFLCDYSWHCLKICKCMGRSHIHHISNGFYHVTFRSPSKIEILMEGAANAISH